MMLPRVMDTFCKLWYDRPQNLSDASHSIRDPAREALRNCWRSTTHVSEMLQRCLLSGGSSSLDSAHSCVSKLVNCRLRLGLQVSVTFEVSPQFRDQSAHHLFIRCTYVFFSGKQFYLKDFLVFCDRWTWDFEYPQRNSLLHNNYNTARHPIPSNPPT